MYTVKQMRQMEQVSAAGMQRLRLSLRDSIVLRARENRARHAAAHVLNMGPLDAAMPITNLIGMALSAA